MSEKRQERTVSKLAIQKAHHLKAAFGVIIFERPGDAMSYFSTEEVDNLKSLRAMVTEDLINEMPLHSHSFATREFAPRHGKSSQVLLFKSGIRSLCPFICSI